VGRNILRLTPSVCTLNSELTLRHYF